MEVAGLPSCLHGCWPYDDSVSCIQSVSIAYTELYLLTGISNAYEAHVPRT